MPLLSVDEREFRTQTSRLLDLVHHLRTVQPFYYQKLVAEIVMLRFFSVLENTLQSVAVKLACGALYVDGTTPTLLHRSASTASALKDMQVLGRPRPRRWLSWTKVRDIKENVRFVISGGDHAIRVLDRHSTFIDELRRVRNRVAHNSSHSRGEYKSIVCSYYGASLNAVTPGVLLLSARHAPPLIVEYMRKAQILLRDVVKC